MNIYRCYIGILLTILPLVAGAQNLINPSGAEVVRRIIVPEDYQRIKIDTHSFASFLRYLPVLPHGAPAKLYDGTQKPTTAAAVIDMGTGSQNLQKTIQSVMRLWAEYLFERQQFSAIHFHIRNGDDMPYDVWAKGMKFKVDGEAHWSKTPNDPKQYRTFRRYLEVIFKYSDAQTFAKDVKSVALKDLAAGDILFSGDHIMMVLDIAVHQQTKEKTVLLVHGGTPAQSLEIPQNRQHKELGAWFAIGSDGVIRTEEATFPASSIYRFVK